MPFKCPYCQVKEIYHNDGIYKVCLPKNHELMKKTPEDLRKEIIRLKGIVDKDKEADEKEKKRNEELINRLREQVKTEKLSVSKRESEHLEKIDDLKNQLTKLQTNLVKEREKSDVLIEPEKKLISSFSEMIKVFLESVVNSIKDREVDDFSEYLNNIPVSIQPWYGDIQFQEYYPHIEEIARQGLDTKARLESIGIYYDFYLNRKREINERRTRIIRGLENFQDNDENTQFNQKLLDEIILLKQKLKIEEYATQPLREKNQELENNVDFQNETIILLNKVIEEEREIHREDITCLNETVEEERKIHADSMKAVDKGYQQAQLEIMAENKKKGEKIKLLEEEVSRLKLENKVEILPKK